MTSHETHGKLQRHQPIPRRIWWNDMTSSTSKTLKTEVTHPTKVPCPKWWFGKNESCLKNGPMFGYLSWMDWGVKFSASPTTFSPESLPKTCGSRGWTRRRSRRKRHKPPAWKWVFRCNFPWRSLNLLVGGFNPFETYADARQNAVHLPQGWKIKIFGLPPPSYWRMIFPQLYIPEFLGHHHFWWPPVYDDATFLERKNMISSG